MLRTGFQQHVRSCHSVYQGPDFQLLSGRRVLLRVEEARASKRDYAAVDSADPLPGGR